MDFDEDAKRLGLPAFPVRRAGMGSMCRKKGAKKGMFGAQKGRLWQMF